MTPLSFWVSGWDPKGFPIKPGHVLQIAARGSEDGKPEAFEVIEKKAYNRAIALIKDIYRNGALWDVEKASQTIGETLRDLGELGPIEETLNPTNLGLWVLNNRPPGVSPIHWMGFLERLNEASATLNLESDTESNK